MRAKRFDRIWSGWAGRMDPDARIREHLEGRERFLQTLAELTSRLPAPAVLEVGCGSAIDLAILARGQRGLRAVGIDLSSTGLQVARVFALHLQAPLRFCRADACRLPFRSNWAGLVFSQGLLEHFRDPSVALEEQARVLAPGGFLVINVPQTFTGYTAYKHLAIRRGVWPWGWEGQFTAGGLLKRARRYDLRPLRVFGYQYWRSWLEPAWVLRDLAGKLERRSALARRAPLAQAALLYTRAWTWIERRYGHHFMQNLVAVFQKGVA